MYFVRVLTLLALAVVFACPVRAQQKPNIILINLDDADSDMLNDQNLISRFPNMDRFATKGLRFTNLHVTSPLCGPSRACLLRGQYCHRTNIYTNEPGNLNTNGFGGGFKKYMDQGFFEDDLSTWMQDAGYRTMMVGKFLHAEVLPVVPPGWDDFYHSMGGRYFNTYRFTNRVHPEGRWEVLDPGVYRTNAERADVVQLIHDQAFERPEQPFFLYINPLTPHRAIGEDESMVEDRFASWWKSDQIPRSPDFDEADTGDKDGVIDKLSRLTETTIEYLDSQYRDRMRAMKSFDLMLGRIFEALEELELDDNTIILLTSDNGYSLGHHRYLGKSLPLDRVTRVPLFVIGPSIPAGETANHLLAHIDIAPTIVELAEGVTPEFVDGQSFYPLLFDPGSVAEPDWRQPILIESYVKVTTIGTREFFQGAYSAMRSYDELYVEYATGAREFFDFGDDPFQLENEYPILGPNERHYLRTTLRELKKPLQDPLVSIGDPVAGAQLFSRRGILKGLASDDWGIREARVSILDTGTRRFWNGFEWQEGFIQLPCELLNEEGAITEWQYRLNFPKSETPEESIRVWTWAYDNNDNYSSLPASREFHIDQQPPVVTLDLPDEANGVFQNEIRMSGAQSDNLAVDQIQVVLRNQETGQFWDGQAMVDHWTFVLATLRPNGTWKLIETLPEGSYLAVVRALDHSRNLASDSPRIEFSIANE